MTAGFKAVRRRSNLVSPIPAATWKFPPEPDMDQSSMSIEKPPSLRRDIEGEALLEGVLSGREVGESQVSHKARAVYLRRGHLEDDEMKRDQRLRPAGGQVAVKVPPLGGDVVWTVVRGQRDRRKLEPHRRWEMAWARGSGQE